MPERNKITIKELEEYLSGVFSKLPKNNRIKMYGYCKGENKAKEYSAFEINLCNDIECRNCRNLQRAFQEEVAKQMNKNQEI